MSLARVTPAQAELLTQVGRATIGSPDRRVVARLLSTVPRPEGVRILHAVGSAVTLERLCAKGYLERQVEVSTAYVVQRYYRLSPAGERWWRRRYGA